MGVWGVAGKMWQITVHLVKMTHMEQLGVLDSPNRGNGESWLLFIRTESEFITVYSYILQAKLVHLEGVFHFNLRVLAEISPFVFVNEDLLLCTSSSFFPQLCLCLTWWWCESLQQNWGLKLSLVWPGKKNEITLISKGVKQPVVENLQVE